MPTYRMDGPSRNEPEGSLQYQFNKSRKKVQIFGGAFANGKTAAACIKALQLAQDYPGCNGLIARESYPKLNDSIRKEFMKWCPKSLIRRMPTKDDNTVYLTNNSVINFRYVQQRGKQSDDGSMTSNLLSSTYDWIIVDQIEDPGITEKDFNDFLGRLRGSTPYQGSDPTMPLSGPRWLILTCNPTANWFYQKVIKPIKLFQRKGEITEGVMLDRNGNLMVDLFEGSTYTNQKNLEDDFLEGLEARYTGQMRDRFLLGKWAAYEGLVYPHFDDTFHMRTREELENYVNYLRRNHVKLQAIEGYDFGLSSPSCYTFGFRDHWGRVFELDGFYKPEYSIPDQAKHIKEIRLKYMPDIIVGDTDKIFADPDVFRRKPMPGYKATGTSISNVFADDFGVKMRPGDNTISSGIAKVHAYLNTYKHVPALFGEESSLIYFCDELHWIRDEFQNYYWKKNTNGDLEDEPMDRNDHYMDVCKYKLSFLPEPSEIEIPYSARIPEWMHWHEAE